MGWARWNCKRTQPNSESDKGQRKTVISHANILIPFSTASRLRPCNRRLLPPDPRRRVWAAKEEISAMAAKRDRTKAFASTAASGNPNPSAESKEDKSREEGEISSGDEDAVGFIPPHIVIWSSLML